MNDKSQRETLSAMLDDEAGELELRRLSQLLKKPGGQPELERAWRDYSLAQAVLHRERVAPLSEDFHLRVADRLREEAAPVPGLFGGPSARQFAGKFAIAASVALAVFIGLRAGLDQGLNQGAATPEIAGDVAGPTAADSLGAEPLPVVEVADVPTTPVDPEARQRLLEYIESMRFDPAQPPRMEHIEDSPLFHLVNDLQD
ncbi:MAG: sigma-E factor negative regulatory protein [Gammaproteobacteria bacterium]|nr:sigma-E factor negative regulatory protein [Gammaproteobacteria bacterium]MCY4295819.1 sigma-E factor negative regulatory protein [Gammaproteobacteria bacterium]